MNDLVNIQRYSVLNHVIVTNETNKLDQNLSTTASKCDQFKAGNSLEKGPLTVRALLTQNLTCYME